MLHRLCGPPSIPLSFTLAGILPRRCTYCVRFGTGGQPPATWCTSFTVRTTRVSKPVRSPHLRASASVHGSAPAFANGVLPDIYRFHPYTGNSGAASWTPAPKSPATPTGWACGFHAGLSGPPARPLRPMIPNNARPLRVTAAAGT